MRNEMTVYMVAGGWSYEGESLELSGKVFRNREDAVQYGEALENEMGYDYYQIKEVEVG